MANDATPSNTNVKAKAPEVPSAFDLFKPSWEGLKLNIVELIMIFWCPDYLLLALYFLIVASAVSTTIHSVGAVAIRTTCHRRCGDGCLCRLNRTGLYPYPAQKRPHGKSYL